VWKGGAKSRTFVQETGADPVTPRNRPTDRTDASVVPGSRASGSTATTLVYRLRSRAPRLADRWRPAGAHVRQGEFVKGQPVPGTRYRVLDLVGVGGMGSVYEVEHIELGKRFVLKALLSDLAMREDLVIRLRNEWRALGRLEHPNIVAVTDAGTTSGNVPYFVMERLEGETLAQRLKRVRRLSPADTLRIANGLLEGLAAAHEIGVVHRDIKPPNIFLSAGNRPKILDFGVAKIADAGNAITARGVAVGTPRYMSPEQASGERVDGRSDLYAVGLILHEMLAGAGPFDDARDANEMLLAHLGRVPPNLATAGLGVSAELGDLVARLLAKEPSARPPNARAAAAMVRAAERSYGARVEPDAPTPPAGELLVANGSRQPSSSVGAPDTVAPVTEELPTRAGLVAEGASPQKDTLIDDRGSTLSGEATFGTRTELLTAVVPPAGSIAETHTRVPVTPPDGQRTLDPVPTESRAPSMPPGSARRRGAQLAGALSLVVVAGVVASFALREPRTPSTEADGPPTDRASAPHVEPAAVVAAAKPPPRAVLAKAPIASVTVVTAPSTAVPSTAPPAAVSATLPSAVAKVPPPAVQAGATTAGAPGGAPPSARATKTAKKPRVLAGLPESGL